MIRSRLLLSLVLLVSLMSLWSACTARRPTAEVPSEAGIKPAVEGPRSRKAVPGDLVLVHYTVALGDGELIQGTMEKPGLLPFDVKQGVPTEEFPAFVIAGESGPFPAMQSSVVGTREGEFKKAIIFPGAEVFGGRSRDKIVQYQAAQVLARELVLPISDYVARHDAFPKVGNVISHTPYLTGTITAVRGDVFEARLSPLRNEFQQPFGVTRVTADEERVTIRLEAEVGASFRAGNKKGVIVEADEEKFVVDFNHPYAGKEIHVDMQIIQIVPSEELKTMTVPWRESYDDGLLEAKALGKPLVLVLYSEECGFCHKYFDTTLQDPRVRYLNEDFVWVKLDGNVHPSVKNRFQLTQYPLTVLLSSDGQPPKRMSGYQDTETILSALRALL